MNQEPVRDWQQLMNAAVATVRRGTPARERRARREFQLVAMPAFDVVASWELWRRSSAAREDSFDVAVVAWDQRADALKLKTPGERLEHGSPVAPTIRSHRVRVEQALALKMLAIFERVQVPLLPAEHPVGADGILYALTIGDAFAGCTFEWWASGPPCWSALTTAALEVQQALSRIAPATTAAAGR